MTTSNQPLDALGIELPPPPAPHPFRPRRVLDLLKTIDDTPEQTDAALELFDAVGGDGGEKTFQKFVLHQDGQRLIRERSSLVSHMADHERLAAMPEGSLGRGYLEFAKVNGFGASDLVDLNQDVERENVTELDSIREWFWDRFTAMHDLWHVVTGCDTTPDGEGLLLAFTLGQVPQRGFRFVVGLVVFRNHIDLRGQRGLYRAWRHGKRARALVRARWEELLPLPLDEVRSRLRVPVLSY